MDRRSFLLLLAIGAAGAAVEGCADQASPGTDDAGPGARATAADDIFAPPLQALSAAPAVGVALPSAIAGAPTVVSHAPTATQQIALTIDDGYDSETVSAYVEFAHATGVPLTFSPNGLYRAVWEPHARVLRPLIEAGQVQIGNHTYDHVDLTRVDDARFREQVERNEEWIEATFNTVTRPYLRPPYGAHDERTDSLGGELGYTKVLLWNASFGDSRLLTPEVLLAQARRYLVPGAIVLGHANHPTVTHLYDQILELIRQRQLDPVTLDGMFGTSRRTGT